MSAIAVLAKVPTAGRSKTRLCPPCTPAEAARLAAAALSDTLTAVTRTSASRRLLVLDDPVGCYATPPGFELLAQRGDGLAERLANAFDDVGEPLVLIGMDTPQVTPSLLERGLALLQPGRAVLGPAPDGGYWAIGLARPDALVFADVPMSVSYTYTAQRARLITRGLAIEDLPPLRDVDCIADAHAAAALAPHGRFAAVLSALGPHGRRSLPTNHPRLQSSGA